MPSEHISDEELEAISDQAEADAKALFRRHVPALVLSLDTILENFVKVIAGEKRIAIVPRTHPKVKEGPVYELRLVNREQVVKAEAPPAEEPRSWIPSEEEQEILIRQQKTEGLRAALEKLDPSRSYDGALLDSIRRDKIDEFSETYRENLDEDPASMEIHDYLVALFQLVKMTSAEVVFLRWIVANAR